MSFIYCNDLQSLLNEFILDSKTLLAWRHTCRQNLYRKYYVMLTTTKKITGNSSCNIFKQMYNTPYIHDIFNILSISELPYYFDDVYISKCKYLMFLNCNYTNNITDLSVQYLINISILICNKVITDTSIAKLTNLVTLDIGDNTSISDYSLSNLSKLKQLLLNDTCSKISDNSISQLTSLTKLHLGNNDICYITNNSIAKLTNLVSLNISNNQYIDNILLPNLKTLYTNHKLVDSSIKTLTSLTHLYCISNDNFTDSVVCNLPKLTLLSCGFNNNFTDITLYTLSRLKYLDCGFNSKFTDNGLSQLTKLKTLYCSYNNNFTNTSLPKLLNLTYLNCGSNNNFTARGIVNLINLKELVCYHGHNRVNIIDLKPLINLKKINGNIFHR